MTSEKKLIANRFNAKKSTGPKTKCGKRQSRRNALRHGLTAETIIATVENSADYETFETAVVAEYQPQTTVECELIYHLASLLWRLRRATAIESGLLRIQADILQEKSRFRNADIAAARNGLKVFYQSIRFLEPRISTDFELGFDFDRTMKFTQSGQRARSDVAHLNIARSFLRLANLDNGAFDRLGRYETRLWRQLAHTLLLIRQIHDSNQEPVFLYTGESLGVIRRQR